MRRLVLWSDGRFPRACPIPPPTHNNNPICGAPFSLDAYEFAILYDAVPSLRFIQPDVTGSRPDDEQKDAGVEPCSAATPGGGSGSRKRGPTDPNNGHPSGHPSGHAILHPGRYPGDRYPSSHPGRLGYPGRTGQCPVTGWAGRYGKLSLKFLARVPLKIRLSAVCDVLMSLSCRFAVRRSSFGRSLQSHVNVSVISDGNDTSMISQTAVMGGQRAEPPTVVANPSPTQYKALGMWTALQQMVVAIKLKSHRRRLKKYKATISGKELTSTVHKWLRAREEDRYKNANRKQVRPPIATLPLDAVACFIFQDHGGPLAGGTI